MLKGIVWDYNTSEEELLEIFLNNKKGHSMNKADIEARLLGYYGWHRIIRVLGYQGLVAKKFTIVEIANFANVPEAFVRKVRTALNKKK